MGAREEGLGSLLCHNYNQGKHECKREASIPGEENNVRTEQLH